MSIIDKIRECKACELGTIFSLIENLKNSKQEELFFELLKRADKLDEFNFISEKGNNWIKDKTIIKKTDNEVLKIILYANIRTDKAYFNKIIYEKKIINYSFFLKEKILNLFAFSLIELNMFQEALTILETIKNKCDDYLENYIDCLVKLKNYNEAIINIKSYKPRTAKGKIWKEINLANIYCEMGDITNLRIQEKIALETFANYRIAKENIYHCVYYYYLGKFKKKLGEKDKAIKMFLSAQNFQSELLIDIKYKKKAEKKLLEMEVL